MEQPTPDSKIAARGSFSAASGRLQHEAAQVAALT